MKYFPSKIQKLLVTWFGCGWIPKAPGTAGSIGALPLCLLFSFYASIEMRILFAIGMTCIAILAAAQESFEHPDLHDPGYIVVDEVAGMLWSTLGISMDLPKSWLLILLAFVLFRILDVLKPYPASFFDRASKTSSWFFHRGFYIVFDDVIAGLYVAIIVNAMTLFSIVGA